MLQQQGPWQRQVVLHLKGYNNFRVCKSCQDVSHELYNPRGSTEDGGKRNNIRYGKQSEKRNQVTTSA